MMSRQSYVVADTFSAEGARLLDQWYVGCDANYIVCEGPSIRKSLGHSSNLVTPAWVMKSAKEIRVQRLVHLSADLARQTGALLDKIENVTFKEVFVTVDKPVTLSHEFYRQKILLAFTTGFTEFSSIGSSADADAVSFSAITTSSSPALGIWGLSELLFLAAEEGETSRAGEDYSSELLAPVIDERQNIASLAKDGVRKLRNRHMQTCKTPTRPITPSSLLGALCWSISQPTSSASIYTNSSGVENAVKNQTCEFFGTKEDVRESETSFVNLSRPLTERSFEL
ncbi:unnamed protein product [Fraxinus pennsylvanica]|uniref:BRCT domain-containing protein n=1 Tax=Fraxinus pennsylvanica TaxID=56036 RepID=A0AAD2EAG9_9LAMI|nr:unnamed protein product [Fraxinus pennsylvanica]